MFNPAVASQNIKQEFVDYITTTYSFADSALREQLSDRLTEEIAKGPFLEIRDVFASGKSIGDLIEEGVLSPLFAELEAGKPDLPQYKKRLPITRKLYAHQERAIRTVVAGNNAVISTGTGSGKTNCFLIPVLNKLLREKEAGTLDPGVRALFIYPMNALANDQMKNIRNILMYYPEITFGVYNGNTENNKDSATDVYEAMFANEPLEELRKPLPNEILSRDEMKKRPPHILFTNYAMLEHLLFRPKDDVLFKNANFSFVVLDEAHIYTGATGIETSILMRRLQARLASENGTQFILTSATLGTDTEADGDIITFANNLCGVPFCKENIIRATRERYIAPQTVTTYPAALYKALADEKNHIYEKLREYGVPFTAQAEAEQLYDFILTTDLYPKLRRNKSEIVSMEEICDLLGVDSQTAIAFISLCTRARKNGKALIDARYHFFVRCLEGVFMSLLPSEELSLTRKKCVPDREVKYGEETAYAVFEVSVCNKCGKIAFVGKTENKRLTQVGKFEQAAEYYFLAEDRNNEVEDEEEDEEEKGGKAKQKQKQKPETEVFYLCPVCGGIVAEDELHNPPCDHGKEKYIKVIKAEEKKTGHRCGSCQSGRYQRFYLGNDAATSVLATSLYEELPEIAYEEENSTPKNDTQPKGLFSSLFTSVPRKKSKETGRQFLTFSDSRQEAAKFACYLGQSYQEFLRRRGICHIVQKISEEKNDKPYTILDYVQQLTGYFDTKRSFASYNGFVGNLTVESKRNAWVAMLNELARITFPTSLSSLGILQFTYAGNTDEMIELVAKTYQKPKENIRSLLNLLAFEIVKAGAVIPDEDINLTDDDRKYIFYSPSQRLITLNVSPNEKQNVSGWMPRVKGNGVYYKSNKLYYVCKVLGIDEEQAKEFLKEYFGYLIDQYNPYSMKDVGGNVDYAMPARCFNVLVSGHPAAHWYKFVA